MHTRLFSTHSLWIWVLVYALTACMARHPPPPPPPTVFHEVVSQSSVGPLVHSDGTLTPSMDTLLHTANAPPEALARVRSATGREIVSTLDTLLQGKMPEALGYRWFLPGERWEMRNPLFGPAGSPTTEGIQRATEILTQLHAMHLDLHSTPSAKTYVGIGVLGATGQSMRKRLDFLETLMRTGALVPHESLLLLTGDRPLNAKEKEEFGLLLPPTGRQGEVELMQALVVQHGVSKYFQKQILCEGMVDPVRKRATTETTIYPFARTFPVGRYLMISNGMYTPVQQAIFDRVLATTGFSIEVVGAPDEPPALSLSTESLLNRASVGLHTVAQIVHELSRVSSPIPSGGTVCR